VEDHHPDKDPELEKNGGKFTSKKAILQVTWRFPLDRDPLNIIALLYGYLPFIIPFTFFVYLIVTRKFIAFYGLVISAFVTVLNEVVLKPILKQPRPSHSANKKFNEKTEKWEMKPGMPSGHVLNASVTLVWCLLEVTLRGPGFGAADSPVITWELILLILVSMAPVPWARIYNGDHSLNQCLVAGSMGLVFGIAAYFIRVSFFPLDAGKVWCPGSLEKIGSVSVCLTSGKPWDAVAAPDDAVSTTAAEVFTSIAKEAKTATGSLVESSQGSEEKSETSEKEDEENSKETESDNEEEEEEEDH